MAQHAIKQQDPHKKNTATGSPLEYDLTSEETQSLKELEISINADDRKIAKLFKEGKLPRKNLGKILSSFRDPNKIAKPHFQNLRAALASNIFPENSLLPSEILDTFENAPKDSAEMAYAKQLVYKRTGKMSKRSERLHKKRLAELKTERLLQKVLEEQEVNKNLTDNRTTSKANISETIKTSENLAAQINNWQPETLTESEVEYYRTEGKNLKELWDKGNEIYKQLISPDLTGEEREALAAKLIKIEEEVADKNEIMRKLIQTRFLKTIAQKRAVHKLATYTGLDLNRLREITVWNINAHSRQSKSGEKVLNGLVINKNGEIEKDLQKIEILKISFTDDKEVLDPDSASPGTMIITYRETKDGPEIHDTFENFINYLRGVEAYEEIETVEDFDKKAENELGFKGLKECADESAVFYAERLTGYDSDNKEVREPETFSIEKIIEKNGKTYVVLDKKIKTLSKEQLGLSTPDVLYLDRYKQEYNLGEFAQLLKANGFERVLGKDEISGFMQKSWSKMQREILEYFPEATEDDLKNIRTVFELNEEDAPSPPNVGETVTRYSDAGEPINITAKVIPLPTATGKTSETPSNNNVIDINSSKKGGGSGSGTGTGKPTQPTGVVKYFRENPDKGPNWLPNSGLTTNQFAMASNEGVINNTPPRGTTLDPKAKFPSPEPDKEMMTPLGIKAVPGEYVHNELESGEPPEEFVQRVEQDNKVENEWLPREKVFKYGDLSKPEKAYLSSLWSQTRIFSISDIWELCKSGYEYYNRRRERRQKERYSSVAKDVPFFSPEMTRVNQNAENEEVNQYKDTLDQMGVFQILDRMRVTNNRDEMKACFIVMTQKGQMRFDDIDIWRNINKFVDPSLAIPIPRNGDPRTQYSKTDRRTGLDFIGPAIDSLWGEGQFNDWYSGNKGAMASGAKKFYEKGKELEGVEGGHEKHLAFLLQQHKEGLFVDPQEYEGLLLHAIEAGKASVAGKLYYMIEGVAAENMHGRTILDFDRMAHINSEMLARFPILEYLAQEQVREAGKTYRATKEDYRRWIKWWDNGDPHNPANVEPNKNVYDFMWKYVVPSDHTQNRINKAIRNGENLDHDDMYVYLPPATEQVIQDACGSMGGSGGKKFFTIEGYANAIPGFSQYMSSLAQYENKNKLMEAIKSYVRFESIVTNRWEKEAKNKYQRFDRATLESATIVTDVPPKDFILEMNDMVRKIALAYQNENPRLMEIVETMQVHTGPLTDENEKKRQVKVQESLELFSKEFTDTLKSDNGQKMLQVVQMQNLTGMPKYLSKEELGIRKAAKLAKKKPTDSMWLD